jgi:integral membrane sensor domain MASE1
MNDGVQQKPLRIYEDVPLLALDDLAAVKAMRIDAGPPFSVFFTLWLSMMQAVGLDSRCTCSRHFREDRRLMERCTQGLPGVTGAANSLNRPNKKFMMREPPVRKPSLSEGQSGHGIYTKWHRDGSGQKSSMFKGLVNSFSPKNVALLALLTLTCLVAVRLGLRLSFMLPYVTPIWIPSGIALAATILYGYRVWPAVFIGSLLSHAPTSVPSLLMPVGITLEGLAGAYLVNKYAHGVRAFDSSKDVLLFVLGGCLCAPLIAPTIGVGELYFVGQVRFADLGFIWLTWWLAHCVGALLIAPFLILLLRASHHRMDLQEFSELTVLLLGLIFVCLLAFGPLSVSLNRNHVVQAWLCVPFLIWAAFRFCPLEAAGTTLILFGSAIWGTLHGYGSFLANNLRTSLILLDTFVGVIGTMTLVVAAMVVERRRIEGELLGTQTLLQDAVERKQRDIVVTVQTLDVEATEHMEAKRALRESEERLRRLVQDRRPN